MFKLYNTQSQIANNIRAFLKENTTFLNVKLNSTPKSI